MDTFDKTERLCSRNIISELFRNGNIIYKSEFKAVWLISSVNLPSPVQVAFSVPKKVFPKAVTRNLLKRRMREAYRKIKKRLYDPLKTENIQLALIIIYTGTRVTDYQTIESGMSSLLDKLLIMAGKKQSKS